MRGGNWWAVGLVLLMGTATVISESSSCNCFNGVVVSSSPVCQCRCFHSYLLPRCLYRSEESTVLDLWIAEEFVDIDDASRNAAQKEPLSSSASHDDDGLDWTAKLPPLLAESFGIGGASSFSLLAVHAATTTFAAPTAMRRPSSSLWRVSVELPGWAAQILLADSAEGRLAELSHFTTAHLSSAAPHPRVFRWVSVQDVLPGPSPLPRYADEWMRLYFGRSGDDGGRTSAALVYLSLLQYGWLTGAAGLVGLLLLLEYNFTFNTEENVSRCLTYRPRCRRFPTAPSPAVSAAEVAPSLRRRSRSTAQQSSSISPPAIAPSPHPGYPPDGRSAITRPPRQSQPLAEQQQWRLVRMAALPVLLVPRHGITAEQHPPVVMIRNPLTPPPPTAPPANASPVPPSAAAVSASRQGRRNHVSPRR